MRFISSAAAGSLTMLLQDRQEALLSRLVAGVHQDRLHAQRLAGRHRRLVGVPRVDVRDGGPEGRRKAQHARSRSHRRQSMEFPSGSGSVHTSFASPNDAGLPEAWTAFMVAVPAHFGQTEMVSQEPRAPAPDRGGAAADWPSRGITHDPRIDSRVGRIGNPPSLHVAPRRRVTIGATGSEAASCVSVTSQQYWCRAATSAVSDEVKPRIPEGPCHVRLAVSSH